jgi:hypothetical protein
MKKNKILNKIFMFSLNDILTNNLNNPKIVKVKKKKIKDNK